MDNSSSQSKLDDSDWLQFVYLEPDSIARSDAGTTLWDDNAVTNTDAVFFTQHHDLAAREAPPKTLDTPLQDLPITSHSQPDTETVNLPTTLDLQVSDRSSSRQETGNVNLTAEFEQALCAVQREAKRKVPLLDKDNDNGDDNASFHKFRVKLPTKYSRTEQPLPKKQRLRRSEQPACLLCKFLKAKCSPGRNCARCIEKWFGQQDLGYNYCLRDSPLKFNLFFVDNTDPRTMEAQEYLIPLNTYLKSRASGNQSSVNVILLYLCYMNHLRSGASIVRASYLRRPKIVKHVLVAQSQLSQNVLSRLEHALRSRELSQLDDKTRAQYALICLYLYSWLNYNDNGEDNTALSEAELVCKQYLTEYLYLLMNHTGFKETIREHLPLEFEMAMETQTWHQFADDLCSHTTDPNLGPRNDRQTSIKAYIGALKLIHTASSEPFLSLSKLIPGMGRNPCSWFLTTRPGPQTDDPEQVLGVWSLFWRQIPNFVRQILNFSEVEFLTPLIRYGKGSLSTALRPSLPDKSWSGWMKCAQGYTCLIWTYIFAVLKSDDLSIDDKDLLLQIFVRWEVSFVYDATDDLLKPPSLKLNGVIRWILLGCLIWQGLFEIDDCSLYVVEIFAATEEESPSKEFRAGFDLYMKVFESVHGLA